MKMIKCLICILLLFLVIEGCATTKIELNPEIKDRIRCVENISIMPPDITAVKSKVSGSEELYVLEQQIAEILTKAAEEAVQEVDLEVMDSGLSKEELDENAES